MMQIPQTVIDEVIARADIVETLSKSIKLKRSGQNYFACCPFHNEKSPSFAVSPVKQIFHCFGCGESGNVLSFVMKYNAWDFISALKNLAQATGVTLPEDPGLVKLSREQQQEHKQHKLSLQQTINNTVAYFQSQLKQQPQAMAYLSKRGLEKNTIERFALGFAGVGFQNLARCFTDYTSNKLLLDAGLVVDNQQGKRYDRFRERIIFPIKNVKGEVIAFGGRVIDKGEPKYLNSPETELFSKSREMYGLCEARLAIRDCNQAIVVEGYMDVIALHQSGITNTVATMGTALSEEQLKILFRLADKVTFAFDGDNAGKKAAWRALERSIAQVTDIKSVDFLFLPQEHDPDSYIRHYGVAEFKHKLNSSALGLISFLLNQLGSEVALHTAEGKARLISLVKPYLEQIKAVALQVMLKDQLAQTVSLDPGVVESILNNRSRFAFYNRKLNSSSSGTRESKQQWSGSPLGVNQLQSLVKSLMLNPRLSREFPVPELEVLDKLDMELQKLCSLISYLEANCDDFSDIDLNYVLTIAPFEEFNLSDLYGAVSQEQAQYSTVFSLPPPSYREILDKLFYGKKRKRPPKMTEDRG